MQIDNILILILEEFSVLENNELREVKFLIKPKKALVPEILLIFNRYVLI